MSQAPPRLSIRARLGVAGARLLISALRLLQRFVNSRAFKIVLHAILRPILRVWVRVFAYRLAFGYTPKWLTQIGPDVAQALAQLEATRNTPIKTEITDRQYAVLQATTWGTAGAGLVLLAAIATSSKPLGTAMAVAAGCFAVTVPLLIVFGFIQYSHYHPEKDRRATFQEALNLMALIYGMQFVFCVGLTAMLYDFNRLVAIAFLCGCWAALRILRRYSVKLVAAPANSKSIATPEENSASKPGGPGAPADTPRGAE